MKRTHHSPSAVRTIRLACLLTASWQLAGVAMAQDQAATPEPVAGTATAAPTGHGAADIIVTGSRISTAGFTAPTPTKVLTAEAIEARGLSSVGDFLNEIPSFRNTTGQTTATSTTLGAGQNYADLRALGSIRTLTLVDGRRHVPSSAFGQVDLNLIPTVLVDRVDVVTGGASAAYGSDAVSGVVNILLNKKLDGFKGDVSYGLTGHNDYREKRASLAFGSAFQEGRGHFVIGGEYVDNSGIGSFFDRDWGREQHGLVSYVGARGASSPSRLYARGVAFTNITYGGLILGVNADTSAANGADVLRGIQFGPGGTTQAFNYGNTTSFGAAATLATDFTGGNAGLFPQDRFPIAVPLKRRSVLAHLDYDLFDNLSLFAEVNYARSGTRNVSPPVRDTTATAAVIRRENPYLPANLVSLMTANGITSFGLGREYDDFGPVATNNQNTTERGVIGFNANLGGGGNWKLDGYYEYGRNTLDAQVDNLRIEQNFRFAIDAVRNTAGQIVCAATDPTNPRFNALATGCVPLNPFGVGSPSQAAIDYVTGTILYKVKTRQQVGSLNLQGEPLSTWAGPVAVAVGGEIRREEANAVSDEISQRNGFNYSNPKPFSGGYTVKEVYGEVSVPLARDMRFARLLDLNGAVRYTDYSTTGGVTTWKLGGTYEPIRDIRFRATRSRDIRAPTNSELFATTSTLTQLVNPFAGGATSQIPTFNQPSPSLQPEKANTWTAGVVFTPSFIEGLSLSADYFDIKIKGAISAYTAQQIIDRCSSGSAFFCGFLDRSGATINSVSVQLLNLASLRSRGWDFEARYRFGLGKGHVTARGFATYTKDLTVDDGQGTPRTYNAAGVLTTVGSVVNRAGSVGGFTAGQNTSATNAPHWVATGSITYAQDPFSVMLQGRYIGGGKFDNSLVGPGDTDYNAASPISIGSNRVSDRFYLDLSGSFDFINDGKRKLQLYGVVSNLTNVDPPFPVIAIAGIYDRVGRYYRAGVRFTY